MSRVPRSVLALGLVMVLSCVACTPSSIKSSRAADGAATGSGGSIALPDAGELKSDALSHDASVCAEQVHAAQPVPVDLLLLVDASSSMLQAVSGGRSKHEMVREALAAFVRDPRSAGMGVGLQFFPLPLETECNSDADCGPFNAGFGKREWWGCRVPTVCAPPNAPLGTVVNVCGPGSAATDCSHGHSCVPSGYCSVTGWPCTTVGQVCKTGVAADACTSYPRICNGAAICNTAMFRKLVVPIADLPGAAEPLVREMDARESAGSTPMEPAVEASLLTLSERAAARPGRAGALVLVTDGLPSGCAPDTLPVVNDIAKRLAMAATASPAVTTYVIGVVDKSDSEAALASQALSRFAQTGGSGAPFVLAPAADLTKTFLAALEQIRNRALPCEFSIPAGAVMNLDFGRVNLRLRGTAGETDVLYVGNANRCDPVRGGWYYDVDPMSGSTPSRVITCPATCAAFKKEAQGHVDLRFGCKTRVVE